MKRTIRLVTALFSRCERRNWAAALLLPLAIVLALISGGRTARAQDAPQAAPPTDVFGVISSDTTWSAAKSPYRVTSLLRIQSGATLTIEPGVVVEVADNATIVVYGALIAEGSDGAPILISGITKSPGSWLGISAGNNAQAPARLSLRHVTVEYGGYLGAYNGGNLRIDGPALVTIEQSTFRKSAANGLNISLDSALQITDTAIVDNHLAALRLAGTINQDPVLSNLHLAGNGLDAVSFESATVGQGLHQLASPGPGVPYRLQNSFTVPAASHLVVQPGVAFQISARFAVQGELTAQGSAAAPILFTRSDPQTNWWGLEISGPYNASATAQLDHVIIEYGGASPDYVHSNLLVNTAVVSVTNSIIRNGVADGIHKYGVHSENPHSLYVADTEITDNAGAALRGFALTRLQRLAVSGNGFDGVTLDDTLTDDARLTNDGLPYLVERLFMGSRGSLTIDPGVEIRFAKDAAFDISSHLIAVGTAEQPIRFTGTQQQPGWWQGLRIHNFDGQLDLRYCEISDGGTPMAGKAAALLTLEVPGAYVADCYFHHGAGPAISTSSRWNPVLRRNRIEENGYGLETHDSRPPWVVDARDNWWGADSGPTHSSNPGGTGAPVGNVVLFQPWLTSPNQNHASGITLGVGGSSAYAPGRTQQYGVFYENFSGQTIKNAVLRVMLPANSDYVDSTGGIFWSARREVFWKLGDIAPGQVGNVVVRIHYDFGIRIGIHTTIAAQLSGSNVNPQPFDLAAYLDYVPRTLTGEVELSAAQVNAERAAHAEVEAIYQQATADGFTFGTAVQQTFSTGETLNQAILLKFDPDTQQMSAFFLWWQPNNPASAIGGIVDDSSMTLYHPGRALRYDLRTNLWQDAPLPEGSPLAQVSAPNVSVAGVSPDGGEPDKLTWSDCMANCIEEKIPGYIIKKQIKVISTIGKVVNCAAAARSHDAEDIIRCAKVLSKVVPGLGEAIDLGTCNDDCQHCEQAALGCNDDHCHCCKEDKYRCSSDDWLYSIFGLDVINVRRCGETGHYLAEETPVVCAVCEKCVEQGDRPVCTSAPPKGAPFRSQLQAASADLPLVDSAYAQKCEDCRASHDPNDMAGPAGDLLPGQWVTYTVRYENVGAGEAYGVFVDNELSDVFDLATLHFAGKTSSTAPDAESIPQNVILSAGARTFFFQVGDLAAKGQPGASGSFTYSIRLKAGLPSGTVVKNQAIVHFPSVPEDTPTNIVANVVAPLVADPQIVQVAAGQSIAIQLHGVDAANAPLTYNVLQFPLHGALVGTAPALTYRAQSDFSGEDRLVFAVSNGITTSRLADVIIQIQPAPGDSTPPSVRWTSPKNNERIDSPQMVGGDEPRYAPMIQIQFSEAMNPESFAGNAVQLSGPDNHLVAVDLNYDADTDQVLLLSHEPLQSGGSYKITVKRNVRDLSGNALAADVSSTFQIGVTVGPQKGSLFLPAIQN